MLSRLCCRRRTVTPLSPPAGTTLVAAAAPPTPDLVSGLPDTTRDSSAVSSQEDKYEQLLIKETDPQKPFASADAIEEHHAEDSVSIEEQSEPAPRSPSIRVEDYSERAAEGETDSPTESPERKIGPISIGEGAADNTSGSQASLPSDKFAGSSPVTRASTPQLSASQSRASNSLPTSRVPTRSPSPAGSLHLHPSSARAIEREISTESVGRDVRGALAACIVIPKQQEDWEAIVRGLQEAEKLALDPTATAPAASWRAVARATSAHVRSLRSRVARAACGTLGALFEARGRTLEPETEEAAGALLDRTADVNRFLRGDAVEALTRVACGVTAARAATALVRRGAAHRAGPVRAAAACALAELVVRGGAARALDLASEPRALLLRAAVDLLSDASPDARAHARRLCVALSEDSRFRPLLKESLPASKYKSVEKSVDRLRCR